VAIWNHTALGFALSKTYAFEFTQKLKTFDVIGGATRFRLNDKLAPYIVSIQWNFTQAQFIVFEEFYKTDLIQGTLEFDMIVLTVVGFISQICNFDDGYTYVKTGNDTKVSAKILVKRDLSLVIDPLTEWILQNGIWEDSGSWDDSELWNDS